jgi:hypothetical protein
LRRINPSNLPKDDISNAAGGQQKYDNTPIGPKTVPVIDTDYFKGVFGDNSTIGFLGEPEDHPPDELISFMEQFNFADRRFDIILKETTTGADEMSSATDRYVKSWARCIPSMEYIARNYGPGSYTFTLFWFEKNEETRKQERKSEKIPFTISDKYQQEYMDYQRKMKLETRTKELEKIRSIKADRQFDDALDGAPKTEKTQDAKEYLREIMEVSRELGLSRQQEGSGLEKIFEKMLPVLPAILQLITGSRVEQANQMTSMMNLLLSQSKDANMQLMEIVKSQSGQGAGQNAVKEFKDMLLGVVDIKEALQGDKKGVADRLFELAEGVLPQVLQIASMSRQQQERDPRVKAAMMFLQHNPDFQAMKQDPAIQQETIRMWDRHYGWRQTDGILSVVGMARPANCPRNPEQENPPVAVPEQSQPDITQEESNGQGNAEETL